MDSFNFGYNDDYDFGMNKTTFLVNEEPNDRNWLILFRGLPGSGKSTKARSLGNQIHLEADLYFEKTGEYLFSFSQLREAHEWCLNTAKVMLTHGHTDVKVANTFTTWGELKPYVEFAVKNKHDIILYTMNNDFGSVHNVPHETIHAMKQRFNSHPSMVRIIKEYINDQSI